MHPIVGDARQNLTRAQNKRTASTAPEKQRISTKYVQQAMAKKTATSPVIKPGSRRKSIIVRRNPFTPLTSRKTYDLIISKVSYRGLSPLCYSS